MIDVPLPGDAVPTPPPTPPRRPLPPMLKMPTPAERFAGDVANHVMKVKIDAGLYRHLSFRDPSNFSYWFDIHTAPGWLMITGDMGTYVFARLEDMFPFFGSDTSKPPNFDYWAEKLRAVDTNTGVRQFSPRAAIAWLDQQQEDLDEQLRYDTWDDFDEMRRAAYDEHEFRQQVGYAQSNHWLDSDGDAERAWQDWTPQYVWCCHAIVWAIKQYREKRATA